LGRPVADIALAVTGLRIVTYNLCEGGQDRISGIAALLRRQHADVIALVEANSRANVETLGHRRRARGCAGRGARPTRDVGHRSGGYDCGHRRAHTLAGLDNVARGRTRGSLAVRKEPSGQTTHRCVRHGTTFPWSCLSGREAELILKPTLSRRARYYGCWAVQPIAAPDAQSRIETSSAALDSQRRCVSVVPV
jgi:hypothetical protein